MQLAAVGAEDAANAYLLCLTEVVATPEAAACGSGCLHAAMPESANCKPL
jgi:hypothetical protein